MKRMLNQIFNNLRPFLGGAFVLAACIGAGAGDLPAEWQHQQGFDAPAAGLVKISLPIETLDTARPGLEDLRLYDAQGNEVPYAIERPRPAGRSVQAARSFAVSLETGRTVITLETGLSQPIAGVTLETPAGNFIKAVQIEGSRDGQQWQVLAAGQPIFRQLNGASRLQIPLGSQAWPWLRCSVDDRRSPPIPFTGARVHAAEPEPTPTDAVPVIVADRHENPGVTRLSLQLPAANLDLANLQLEAGDPIFTRQVTVAVPQVVEDAIREQPVAQGAIYRVAVDGELASTNLAVGVETRIRSRELVVLVRNQDSPPLAISGARATRYPVHLVFYAREPGAFRMLTGNNRCAAPSYDLASLGAGLKKVPVTTLVVSPREPNPGYRASEVLAGIQDGATAIEVADWKYRKALKPGRAGAQQLELDLDVLAHAQPGFGDLRLVRAGKQVPYILERTSIARSLTPVVSAGPDAKDPKLTRWSLKFTHPNLPLTRLSCAARTPLFKREIALYEELQDDRGQTYRRSLAGEVWVQTPEKPVKEFALTLNSEPRGDRLFLETHNGDNPAIELEKFQASYPATRILFKDGSGEELFLYYGNPQAAAPRYDLSLVAGQLLAADKAAGSAGPEQQLKKSGWAETHVSGKGGWLFWGILAVVVIGLLVIIARLLPKSPSP